MFAKVVVLTCFLGYACAGKLYNSAINHGSALGYRSYAPALGYGAVQSYGSYGSYSSGLGYDSVLGHGDWSPLAGASPANIGYASPLHPRAAYPATAVSTVSQYRVDSSPALKAEWSAGYGSLNSGAHDPYSASLAYGGYRYGGYGNKYAW